MQTWTAGARKAGLTLMLCALLCGVGNGQRSQTGSTQTGPIPTNPHDPMAGADSPAPPGMVERQTKARNDERQRRLVSDTDKLLELATQLHTDVARTDKNVLSLDVIHRADEIEKLAHAVKERMKG